MEKDPPARDRGWHLLVVSDHDDVERSSLWHNYKTTTNTPHTTRRLITRYSGAIALRMFMFLSLSHDSINAVDAT